MKSIFTSALLQSRLIAALIGMPAYSIAQQPKTPQIVTVDSSHVRSMPFKNEQGKVLKPEEVSAMMRTGNYMLTKKLDNNNKPYLQFQKRERTDILKPVYIKP